MNIFLSCTKEKADKRCKAREMYMPSSLFSKSYKYAMTMNPDKIYILSAKHHLLPLSRIIEPYNETLNDASVDERKEWSEEVIKQMKEHNIDFNAKTYFFCGENYIEFLKEHFPNSESMYEGKGIGEIMHWLDKQLDKKNESLSEYIKYKNNNDNMRSLYESLIDVDNNIDVFDESMKDQIKQFLKDNFNGASSCKISNKPNTNGKYEVSSIGDVEVNNKHITSLTNGMFIWAEVGGGFYCYDCKLTSLEGSPKKVRRDFECNHCNSLTSLKGSPKEVGGHFWCNHCDSLTSLEGSPREVGRDFHCYDCHSLTSLKGAPEKVGGDFYCYNCISLKSLEGSPKEVEGDFDCHWCDSLTSLKGAPKEVGWNFSCWACRSLTSLEGSPKKVGGDFDCSKCKVEFSEEDIKKVSNVKGTIKV